MKIDTIKMFLSSTLRLGKISLVILIPRTEGKKGIRERERERGGRGKREGEGER